MGKIVIEFNTDNAAFDEREGGFEGEVGYILARAQRRAIKLAEEGGGTLPLLDSNGNTVGTVRVEA